jgi:hypothetical protein
VRYFRSHGPATVADLARWTGLTVKDCRTGVAVAGDALTEADGMIMDAALRDADLPEADDWLALAGFDEYMLGYKDRSLMLADEHKQAIIPGGNGMFQATVVRDGRVVGTWRRTLGKTSVQIAVRPLVPLGKADRTRAERAFAGYARFLRRAPEVRWP